MKNALDIVKKSFVAEASQLTAKRYRIDLLIDGIRAAYFTIIGRKISSGGLT